MPRFAKMQFPGLYGEFVGSGYMQTLDGMHHLEAYEKGRAQGRLNFESVVEASDGGQDVTELVLLKLLPHNDTAGNRDRGAWVHIAPAIRGDVRRWFESKRWTRPDDWPAIAEAILRFVRRCDEDPERLDEACAEFAGLPYAKGFQTGMLTPILNALRPEAYLLVNSRSLQTINYFSGESHGFEGVSQGYSLIEGGKLEAGMLVRDVGGDAKDGSVPAGENVVETITAVLAASPSDGHEYVKLALKRADTGTKRAKFLSKTKRVFAKITPRSSNRKTRNQGALTGALADYPAMNRAGRRLIEEFAEEMDQPGAPGLSYADRFDMFSHWLVAERNYPFPDKRYWKIAPGKQGWQWEECKEGGFIAIGWDELGDLSRLDRAKFETLQSEMKTERGWTKEATDQVWTFAHDIQEGDRVLANRGTREILGIGTVIGPYEYVPGIPQGHRLPVRWDDTEPRRINEQGWRSALIEIKPEEKFEELRAAPPADGARQPDVREIGPAVGSLFTAETFDLLAGLHEDPTKAYYNEFREAIKEHVEEPFRLLVREVAKRLPAPITGLMETEKGVFARILKNDYGKGGAWDFYWGAFYPKGGKRTTDAQLSTWINRDQLEFGFYIGAYGSDQRERFLANCKRYREELVELLEPMLDEEFVYGDDKGSATDVRTRSFPRWLENVEELGIDASIIVASDRVLERSQGELVDSAVRTFELLFPFALLATSDGPMPEIIEYIGKETPGPEPEPEYGIEQLSLDTGIGEEELRRWVQAVERKGQAIFYGPPGTGKTFIAQHLARHLIGGGDGFSDIVQFHPSYSYEDFVQGIRPASRDGNLSYPVLPGRFKEFCREAAKRKDTCVLVIDEINRANLSRVFGELMYLLEYREEEVPLAGGGKFRIPENVRLIGTMNTADRSIALVDHALRRRFAFLELYPDYELLRRFHSTTGFPVDGLIGELRKLNMRINDRHYEVGITFFLHEHLQEELEDIWRMEIEPYLEEYFFDRPAVVDEYRWERIGGALNP